MLQMGSIFFHSPALRARACAPRAKSGMPLLEPPATAAAKNKLLRETLTPALQFQPRSVEKRYADYTCHGTAAEKQEAETLADVEENAGDSQGPLQKLVSIGIFALWVLFCVYAFAVSPDMTPEYDLQFMLASFKLLKDEMVLNPVCSAIFTWMGIYPILYIGLLIPSARSKNKVPAWPFLVLSLGLGASTLLPYFALWQFDPTVKAPPTKGDLEGWSKLPLKILESPIFPCLLVAVFLYFGYLGVMSGSSGWNEYLDLFSKSRLIHVSTIDFVLLSAVAPFWVFHDASVRLLSEDKGWIRFLAFVPLIGPLTYLILRPKPT